MLPKAEGCCTGLQLSAKEVVLGRPDMVSRCRSAPVAALFLPPPRPGGSAGAPAAASLAQLEETGGTLHMKRRAPPSPSPSPPPGEAPSPLGASCSLRPVDSSSSSSRRPFFTTPSLPAAPVSPRAASARRAAPPGTAPAAGLERGGSARPRCPHPGHQSHGAEARGPAPQIPPPAFSVFPFFSFFFSSSFSSSSSFPLPSPLLPPLLWGRRQGTGLFFPRRKDLGAPGSADERWRGRSQGDPAGAAGSAAGGVGWGGAGGLARWLERAFSAGLRLRLRRGSSLRPQGQLTAAQAGDAALRAAGDGGGAGHDGGGSPDPPQAASERWRRRWLLLLLLPRATEVRGSRSPGRRLLPLPRGAGRLPPGHPPCFCRSVPLSALLPPLRAGLLPLRPVRAQEPRSRLCPSPPYAAERP